MGVIAAGGQRSAVITKVELGLLRKRVYIETKGIEIICQIIRRKEI
jgi:hypothetical protein